MREDHWPSDCNVPCKDVECDEIWVYVGKKDAQKGPKEAYDYSIGDQYCLVAIERNTKFILNSTLGRRDTATRQIFIEGLRAATLAKQKFQVSTDGFQADKVAIGGFTAHCGLRPQWLWESLPGRGRLKTCSQHRTASSSINL